jgi:hypothetical protein
MIHPCSVSRTFYEDHQPFSPLLRHNTQRFSCNFRQAKKKVVQAYGDVYFRAWKAATGPYLDRIEQVGRNMMIASSIRASTSIFTARTLTNGLAWPHDETVPGRGPMGCCLVVSPSSSSLSSSSPYGTCTSGLGRPPRAPTSTASSRLVPGISH